MIETNRLLIRFFKEEDITPEYLCWLNDPEVVKYSSQRFRKHTIESCKNYFNSFKDTDNIFWAVCLKSSGKLIATMTNYISVNNQTADMGIMIGDKDLWGKGLGLEMWTAVMAYLFKEKSIRKITAGTMAINTGMLKIMDRAGMEDDGIRKKQLVFADEFVDVVYKASFQK